MLKQSRNLLFRLLGLAMLAIGTIGIVVPLLPTIPLWILAAFLFAKSAPELQQKIYSHPQFGPSVEAFVEHGALSPKGKIYAIAGVNGGSGLSLWLATPPAQITIGVIVLMMIVSIWLATRRTIPVQDDTVSR